MQVTALQTTTVPDRGVVRLYDLLKFFGSPIISLERLNLKSSRDVTSMQQDDISPTKGA